MSPPLHDLQAILTRIERLERQNRRVKLMATTALLLLAVGLLGAFQTDGEQHSNPSAPAILDPRTATLAAYGPLAEKCAVEQKQNCYVEAMLALPNTTLKLDFLARAVDDLWEGHKGAFLVTGSQNDALHRELNRQAEIYDKNFRTVQSQLDQIGALASDNDSRIRAMQNGVTSANPQLDEFKDAACPVLRTARMDETARMKLNSACGLH
jgi:hypothetical protein